MKLILYYQTLVNNRLVTRAKSYNVTGKTTPSPEKIRYWSEKMSKKLPSTCRIIGYAAHRYTGRTFPQPERTSE